MLLPTPPRNRDEKIQIAERKNDVSDLEQKLADANDAAQAATFAASRAVREKEQLATQNAWLEERLTEASAEVLEAKKKATSEVHTLRADLEAAQSEVAALSSARDRQGALLAEQRTKNEAALVEIRTLKDEAASAQVGVGLWSDTCGRVESVGCCWCRTVRHLGCHSW